MPSTPGVTEPSPSIDGTLDFIVVSIDFTRMKSPLDDVKFLLRSSNRVEILEAVTESPRTPHGLREVTGASRMTINRILDDLEDRGWISHENGQWESTYQGRIIRNEFTRLLSNLAVAGNLDDALTWLPTEAFDFDLAHLQDATVLHTSSWEDHTGVVEHVADMVSNATRIWGTATGISHAVAEAIRETTVEGDARFDVVMNRSGFDMIHSDAALTDQFRDVIESDNATVRRYDGDAPLHLVMGFDETVAMCGHDSEGPPPGILETTDETVRTWARSYYVSARDDATPITIESLGVDHHEVV